MANGSESTADSAFLTSDREKAPPSLPASSSHLRAASPERPSAGDERLRASPNALFPPAKAPKLPLTS